MGNLYFSLCATMPVFLVMVVGYVIKRIGIVNDSFIAPANKLVFKVTLPAMLLMDMMECDIKNVFDGKYIAYCSIVTITCILSIWLLARLILKDKSLVGEFVQGSYRGSAAILGMALLGSISGNNEMGPLMMLGSVPLYNVFAVTVLTFEAPDSKQVVNKREKIKKSVMGIFKNPIIISIFMGMVLSYFDVTFPKIIDKTINSVGSITTPLALIAIGAGFEGRKAIKKVVPTVAATMIKLIIQPMIFLPVAVALGFSAKQIAAALIMLGAPTTATSYVMSKSMGHEGVLSSSIVVLTTLLSAFSITMWIFILKSLNVI